MSHQTHPYHIVNPSPWPALAAIALLMVTFGTAMFLHQHPAGIFIAVVGLALVLYTMFVWWRDVIFEARVEKAHTAAVSRGLRAGMALFITSEVLFFAAFFWAFFQSSTLPVQPLSSTWAIAPGTWPPSGIHPFNPFNLPFLNTLILLLSGSTVTWAHYAIQEDNRKDAIKALWCTVILGLSFTACQAFEYTHSAFTFTQGIYATVFYMATGFHGFHVIVGTIFLAVCLGRVYKGQFTPKQHLGFEFAAWYWHFVDVVWLFLFVFIYNDMANRLMPAFEAIFTGTNLLIAFILLLIIGGYVVYRKLMSGALKLPATGH